MPPPPVVLSGVQAPQSGWHLAEWLSELAGTALLLLGGISAICLCSGRDAVLSALVPSASTRLLLTGLLFAGTGSLVAVSPLGRVSGAHLNPVITLAFWTQGKVHGHDVAGYLTAQFVGGLLGALVALGLWGSVARRVHDGATVPGPGVSVVQAIAGELAMTGCLVLVILLMTSSVRTARWTPLVLWPLIATLVWRGARYTGTSLNPARSAGPAILGSAVRPLGIYFLGPLLGAAAAVGVFGLFRSRHTVTAKLFHDARYPSVLGHCLAAAHGRRAAAAKPRHPAVTTEI